MAPKSAKSLLNCYPEPREHWYPYLKEEKRKGLPFTTLPIGTSHFCLVRLDDEDNMFMTGGSAAPKDAWLFKYIMTSVL